MILGKIIGKTTTKEFKFKVEQEAKKFQYIEINAEQLILAQITEIEKTKEETIAQCNIIGYRDKENKLKTLRIPLEPNTEVLTAKESTIESVLGLVKTKNSAFMGTLEGYKNLNVYIDLNKILTKHLAILAKSGSGKSYSAAVILEELLERKIPMLIIDPHGEYSTLKHPNLKEKDKLKLVNLEPKGFSEIIQEFSPDTKINPQAKPLKLNANNLSSQELTHLLPAKLSNAQLGCLYSVLRDTKRIDFNTLISELEMEENNAKYSLISIIEYLNQLEIFSSSPTLPSELITQNKASIINLKGIPPEVSEVVVYKLLKDLFDERKKGNIPPFFLVLEEAHNFVPERNFGETKASGIIRQIFAEGRKFGLGACIITQRPSRIEKNTLSQVTTQIILKLTNPNDIKAVSNSVEGITSDTEKEIQNISIGTAMLVGVVDLPLFINVRPRKTKHGGEAVNMLEIPDAPESEEEQPEGELLPLIKPNISLEDKKIIEGKKDLKTSLIPCTLLTCSQNNEDFNILINLNTAEIIKEAETLEGLSLRSINLPSLSENQKTILTLALKYQLFKPSELFAKSGLQFSELHDVIESLIQKGYFIKEGTNYNLSPKLQNLNKSLACYEKVDFSRIIYDNKKEIKYNQEEIIKFLKTFFEVRDKKDCFLVSYQ